MGMVMGGQECQGIMATQTEKSKLPDRQAPHPIRIILIMQSLESEAKYPQDCPIVRQKLHHYQSKIK